MNMRAHPALEMRNRNTTSIDSDNGRLIGSSIPRFEDERLVTGTGSFVGDVHQRGMAHAVVLRSSWAHGRIAAIDTADARAMPGVLAILAIADLDAAGLGGIPWEVCPPPLQSVAKFQGDPAIAAPQSLLARDRVRYVGEPLAFVVAETKAQALDAAEAIGVTIEDLPAIVDARAATGDDAPLLHDGVARNILFRHEIGDAAAVGAAFARAAHVERLVSHAPRLTPAPIEPRGYVGHFDPGTRRYTLDAAAGKPHPVRNTLARAVFGIDPTDILVRASDIGGGFGGKNVVHAEQALVLWASRVTGRPVRWISDRVDAFLSDMQGRDHSIDASIALDRRGRILAIRYESIVALGAWLAPRGVIPTMSGLKVLTGAYAIPAAHARVSAVHTNTVPTCPYRGAGVPETIFVLERLVDLAALHMGIDPAEIRRRNLIRPDMLPYRTPVGTTHHSVDYPALLEHALTAAGWQKRPPSRQKNQQTLRGKGISFSLEAYGTTFEEQAELVADAKGSIEVRIGTMSGGQSHETVYRQIAADALGIAAEAITILQGDTDRIERGNGTGASRSITTGGSALWHAAANLIAMGKQAAADALQCEPGAIAYEAGQFRKGHEPLAPAIGFAGLAAMSGSGILHARALYKPDKFNFPAGCHVAEVEVDVETGQVRILRYHAVQDSGVAIHPGVVLGQMHGGLAQGIGAAMMEAIRWDEDSGQALTATFLDYAMPRASDLPSFAVELAGTPCASNPLGAKAVGEAGPVAAPPAIVNAVVDALRPLGVEHIEMPLTPERVWHAIADATARRAQSTMKSNDAPAGA